MSKVIKVWIVNTKKSDKKSLGHSWVLKAQIPKVAQDYVLGTNLEIRIAQSPLTESPFTRQPCAT